MAFHGSQSLGHGVNGGWLCTRFGSDKKGRSAKHVCYGNLDCPANELIDILAADSMRSAPLQASGRSKYLPLMSFPEVARFSCAGVLLHSIWTRQTGRIGAFHLHLMISTVDVQRFRATHGSTQAVRGHTRGCSDTHLAR